MKIMGFSVHEPGDLLLLMFVFLPLIFASERWPFQSWAALVHIPESVTSCSGNR
jgi:hypothetical protein